MQKLLSQVIAIRCTEEEKVAIAGKAYAAHTSVSQMFRKSVEKLAKTKGVFMNNKGFTVIEMMIVLFLTVAAPACLYGWVANIVKLFHSTFDPITGAIMLRVIGVFLTPLGVVMGYL